MSRQIKADLVGVIHVAGLVLKAGDVVPDGVIVGDHAAEDEPDEDEKAPKRARKTADEG